MDGITRVALIPFFFFLFTHHVACWGESGHNIVAWLGEQQLSSVAGEHIRFLLDSFKERDMIDIYPYHKIIELSNESLSLSDIAILPDLYKKVSLDALSSLFSIPSNKLVWKNQNSQFYSVYNATAELHFSSRHRNEESYHPCSSHLTTICEEEIELPDEFPCSAACIEEAIVYYMNQLRNPKNQYLASTALIFLVHLIGDIHQPFHCGFEDDRGGNNATAFLPEKQMCVNLHALWDTHVLDMYLKTKGITWVALGKQMLGESRLIYQEEQVRTKSVLSWRKESAEILLKRDGNSTRHTSYPYSLIDPSPKKCSGVDYGQVSIDYREWCYMAIERRLKKAGSRLALVLNSLLTTKWLPPTQYGHSYLYKLSKKTKDK